MGRLIAVLLICFIIIGLSCESSVVVPGGGSDGTTPLPVINPRQPSLPSPRDPSTFVHPILPNLPNPKKPTNPSSSTNISANRIIPSSTMSFSMTSRVVGTSSSISHPSTGAGFSERRYLIADNGFDAKQTSSALNGYLDESRFISFYKDKQESTTENSSTAVLISEDQTKFFGTYYNDRAVYSNEGDFVRN
jgi:hypothetical protein